MTWEWDATDDGMIALFEEWNGNRVQDRRVPDTHWLTTKLKAAVAELQRLQAALYILHDQRCWCCNEPLTNQSEHACDEVGVTLFATPSTPAPTPARVELHRGGHPAGFAVAPPATAPAPPSVTADQGMCKPCGNTQSVWEGDHETGRWVQCQACINMADVNVEPPRGFLRDPDRIVPSPDGCIILGWVDGTQMRTECELDTDKLRAALAALPAVMGEPIPAPAGEQRRCPTCGSATCEGTHMVRDRDYSANEKLLKDLNLLIEHGAEAPAGSAREQQPAELEIVPALWGPEDLVRCGCGHFRGHHLYSFPGAQECLVGGCGCALFSVSGTPAESTGPIMLPVRVDAFNTDGVGDIVSADGKWKVWGIELVAARKIATALNAQARK